MRSISRPLCRPRLLALGSTGSANTAALASGAGVLGAPSKALPSSSARSFDSAAFVWRASALWDMPSSSATSRLLRSCTKRR